MFENLTNLSKLMRGAGSIMPKVQAAKEKLARQEVESISLSGAVRVVLSGGGVVSAIEIRDTSLSGQDLESEIQEVMNEAIQKAKRLHLDAVQHVVGDLGIPGIDRIIAQLAE